MANTTSAKKATRKIARRTIINKSRRTQMRGAVRIVEEAIKSGDRDAGAEGNGARRTGTHAGRRSATLFTRTMRAERSRGSRIKSPSWAK